MSVLPLVVSFNKTLTWWLIVSFNETSFLLDKINTFKKLIHLLYYFRLHLMKAYSLFSTSSCSRFSFPWRGCRRGWSCRLSAVRKVRPDLLDPENHPVALTLGVRLDRPRCIQWDRNFCPGRPLLNQSPEKRVYIQWNVCSCTMYVCTQQTAQSHLPGGWNCRPA